MNMLFLIASAALIATPAALPGQQPRAKAAVKSAQTQKYCLTYETVVGSRLRQTECKTKADWADQGVDVDELQKKK